ncbi:DUF1775 domain-containing protein [Streptomyces violaceusniger]|uniref:YncI copper-binding domain-containing protein n=1 Tax=Streptomyces violaceusniger (strain Tu 4113) TaxID=653045 RepID=G2P420_STRV4|nr:DUF1775 domain-containing protein [Streptomyces violaceusniger]AEM84948.1 hypothetical protein Strvi_5424 [Streptomyces violaceusniger Tu 4113]
MNAHHLPSRPRPRRIGALAFATSALVLTTAAPALAHTEVSTSDSRALAKNVTLTFESEAEAEKAGFTEIRTVLPKGIGPGDVELKQAPKGWKLKRTDDGHTVGGPALALGENAEHSVVVRQLPDATSLAFKTVDTYEGGKVSRWIKVAPEGEPKPENPAPLLRVESAAAGGAPTASPSASPRPESEAPDSDGKSPSKAATSDDGSPWPAVGVIIGVCLVALAGGFVLFQQRRGSGTE